MSYEKVTQVKSRLIIGTKQSLKALKTGIISEVFIAVDADQEVTQGVVDIANELEVPVHYVNSKEDLGRACGIDVHAATVSIKKP
ncbi:50S ribosomal protein L7ae-like protein [Cerasibacillus terrae]|uniref:50S ribosomal protein L7ae-like protein n=1 Tax=Cerasibacillus terrae TaxID=2498845 RepID=A0A5C8NGJ9_9BACI|nr:ribosomal L7Ae/L30e/S12e/Gadd45 family protein [Cerasibacillus terrae]TXL61024.1 50S ribosomal protein L7ae-like protein [Cerasibacillus terrae]